MSERMSEEELDRLDSGIVVSLDAGDLYADDADGLRRMVAEARRARAAEERLTKALEEIIFGIERHDDTDGGWMPMNATEVVDIARRALRPTHNTAAESRKEER